MFQKFIRKLAQKYFIEGNLRDILGHYSRTRYRYNYSGQDFLRLCTESYNRSTDFQEAIAILSRGCADLPLCMQAGAMDTKKDVPQEIKAFMTNPSKEQLIWPSFIQACFVQFFVSGEIFLLKDRQDQKVILIRPDEVNKVEVVDGVPWRYTISQGFFERTKLLNFPRKEQIFESTFKDGYWQSDIAHFYNRNPLFSERGLSIVVALLNDIEILFKGRTWNRAMLENEGRPSGIFYYPPTTAQGKRPMAPPKGQKKAQEEIQAFYGGDINAGKALFLKGGMQFQEVTYKMVDMDFVNGLHFSRESIANRLGIPLQLFGSEKASTYHNMREARFGFYENTCVPFFNEFLHFFSMYIINEFFESITKNQQICIDKTRLFKKSPVFLERIAQLQAQQFLTGNEKRELLGYEPLEDDNMDVPLIPSTLVPVEDAGMVDDNQDPDKDDPDDEDDDDEDDDDDKKDKDKDKDKDKKDKKDNKK